MTYTWRLAHLLDLDAILALCRGDYHSDVDSVFTLNDNLFLRNLGKAIVDQTFAPTTHQIIVAYDDQQLLAWAWISSNHYMSFSPDNMAESQYIQTARNLSLRIRVKLCKEILEQWELWAMCAGCKVICSSTLRAGQQAFLKLHQRHGYDVRGSVAYKRISHDTPTAEVL
jgi:hypothetical protein